MKTDEKKELLSLTNKRWNLLKKRIGKNIINYIQKISPKEEERRQITDEEWIEEILEEADSYGLRYEVETFAKDFLEENPTLSKLEAYVMAYRDWLK